MGSKLGGLALLVVSLFGVWLGLYVGLWVCYVGSVVEFIDVCKAPTTDAGSVAWCLVKFFIGGSLALVAGFWIAFLSFFGGMALLFGKTAKVKPNPLLARFNRPPA